MVTVARKEKYITHNLGQFKPIEPSMKVPEDNDSGDPDILDDEADRSDTCQDSQHVVPAPAQQSPRRYPVRQRKVVHRYGQNIYEQ